jgi:hypothetical protein
MKPKYEIFFVAIISYQELLYSEREYKTEMCEMVEYPTGNVRWCASCVL